MIRPALFTLLTLFALASPGYAQSQPLVTSAIVNAPIDQVWQAWTTKEGIESWMVAKTDFELRVGALWRTSYNRDSTLDDGASIHQSILAFDPERMLAFRTVKVPANFPFAAGIAHSWTVVYFEPVGQAQTSVVVRMLGYDGDAETQRMRAFFEQGNRSTLDALVKKFAAR